MGPTIITGEAAAVPAAAAAAAAAKPVVVVVEEEEEEEQEEEEEEREGEEVECRHQYHLKRKASRALLAGSRKVQNIWRGGLLIPSSFVCVSLCVSCLCVCM